MLGIILLYFIWKYYSELAEDYNKSKWGYTILGIATYYAGTFIAGIILGMIGFLIGSKFSEEMPNLLLSLIAMPFGILAVWLVYRILEYRWSRQTKVAPDDTLDNDLI